MDLTQPKRRSLPPRSKVYISGPISGYASLNEAAFRKAERHLRLYEMQPLVPHDIPVYEHDGECPMPVPPGGQHGWSCYMRTNLMGMLTCDAIYLLRGWQASHGARAELEVALVSGLIVLHEEAVTI